MKNLALPLLPTIVVTLLALVAGAASEEIRLRALTIAGRQVAGEVYVHDGSGGPGERVRVMRFLNHQHQRVDLETGILTLTTAADPASTGDPERLLAKVELEAGAVSAILLFVPGTGEGAVEARLIDDSQKAFPAGSFLVVSQCDEPLKIDLEGEEFEVPAAGTKLIDRPTSGNHPGMIQMTALRNDGDAWQPIASGRWALPGDARELHVATINPRSGNIEIRGIKDVARVD